MMPKYLGPARTFQLNEGGKVYRRGDHVPLSDAQVEHLGKAVNGNHRFAGVEAEERAPEADKPLPRDARGEYVEPKAKK